MNKWTNLCTILTRWLLRPPEPCYPGHAVSVPIRWNIYRCPTCAARRQPERLYHRLAWRASRGRYDPFGRLWPPFPRR